MNWLQMLEATTYTGPNLAISTELWLEVEEKFGTEGVGHLSLYVESGKALPEYLVEFVEGLAC